MEVLVAFSLSTGRKGGGTGARQQYFCAICQQRCRRDTDPVGTGLRNERRSAILASQGQALETHRHYLRRTCDERGDGGLVVARKTGPTLAVVEAAVDRPSESSDEKRPVRQGHASPERSLVPCLQIAPGMPSIIGNEHHAFFRHCVQ